MSREMSTALGLRFWDVDVCIQADEAEFVEWFGRFYARCRIPLRQLRADACVYRLHNDPGADPHAWLTMPGQPPAYIADLHQAQNFLYDRILYDILSRVRGHLLFHAGALALAGEGVLLAGDAMHGKTTLTLGLVRRGAACLSDELGALGRADGRLYPFPRALRLRPGTLTRLGAADLEAATPSVWAGKQVLDIETGGLGRYAVEPVPVRHVFCLTGAATTAASETQISVRVSCANEAWLAAVAQLPQACLSAVDKSATLPQVSLTTTARSATLQHIERLCLEHGVLWLDVMKRDSPAPDFEQAPRLTPIRPTQAAWQLLTHFQAGPSSYVFRQDMRNQGTRLLAETTRLLATARCFTLSVGWLPAMLALIEAQVLSLPQTPAMIE